MRTAVSIATGFVIGMTTVGVIIEAIPALEGIAVCIAVSFVCHEALSR